jgi:hypothetical protein
MESRRRVAAVVDATPSTDARCFPQLLHQPAVKRDSVVGSSAGLSAALRLACTSRFACRACSSCRALVQNRSESRPACCHRASGDPEQQRGSTQRCRRTRNSRRQRQFRTSVTVVFCPFVPVAGVQSASEGRCCLPAQTWSSGRAICRSEPTSSCDWWVVWELHCRGKPPHVPARASQPIFNRREPQRLGRHFRPMQRARVSPCLTLCARSGP